MILVIEISIFKSSLTPLFLTASSEMIAIPFFWLNFFRRALLSEEVNYPSSVAWIVNMLSRFILACSPGSENELQPMKITRIRNLLELLLDFSES